MFEQRPGYPTKDSELIKGLALPPRLLLYEKGGKQMNKKVLVIGLVGLGFVLGAFLLYRNGIISVKTKPASNAWQAVFLTNGQVYFGHLAKETRQYATLADIYYLQIEQQSNLQPEKQTDKKAGESEPKLTLIKLGNELHGPSDLMRINRDQIVFVEDMKSDSKVVTAIEEYKKSQK